MSALLDLLAQGAIIGAHLVTAHQADGYTEGPPPEPPATIQPGDWHRFRSFNPGLYIMLPSGLTAGAYRNSYGSATAYAGYTLQSPEGHFALTVGAAVGYPYGAFIKPIVVPSARMGLGALGADAWSLRVSLALKRPGDQASTTAVHLSVERRFGGAQ